MATSSDRQQENVGDNIQQESSMVIKDEYWRYIPLVKAALAGDWDVARRFFDQDQSALTAPITPSLETALHIAVGTGKTLHFVKELVESMPVEALEARDHKDDTALHIAAWVGNTAAAVLLAEKHQPLLYMRGSRYRLPVHLAAVNGRKDTLSYLLRVTMDDPVAKPYSDESGIWLLMYVLTSGFYDIALNLLDRYPYLATLKIASGDCALGNIATKVSAFPSGSRLNLWERIIYSYVPVKLEKYSENQNRIDIENHINISQEIAQKDNSAPYFGANFSISGHRVSQKLQAIVWKFFELSVPRIKYIQEQKQTHHHALQLVKCLCEGIRSLNNSIAYESLATDPLFKAVKLG
ncbi:Serine/threonine-protein phosphatase 6 regulatory ankyrin repeat subunit B like, partial [Actinidia chinensis var. chinensis]